MVARLNIQPGHIFNKLTVIKEINPSVLPSGQIQRKFKLKCSCDKKAIVEVLLTHLRSSVTKDCGCGLKELWKAKSDKSGVNHPLRPTYTHMIDRCYDPNDPAFGDYGWRGIYVCDDWSLPDGEGLWEFVKWAEANGWYKGCGLSIDRIDNDGPYSPKNCRWTTMKEQQRNRRDNLIVTYKGKKMVASEALEKYGVKGLKGGTFYKRLANGWSAKKALTQPSRYDLFPK